MDCTPRIALSFTALEGAALEGAILSGVVSPTPRSTPSWPTGITEAESPQEEELGMGRLIELLHRERQRPLAELVEEIVRTVGEFSHGRPQGDDQTLVLLRRE